MKIILLNKKLQLVEDLVFLQEVKNILNKNISHPIMWNGKLENFTIKWDTKALNEIQKQFIGDLFSFPIYEMDSIIVQHTEKIIATIKTDYVIQFYITRIIMDKQISKETCGVISFNN
jgi:hypothetical protein